LDLSHFFVGWLALVLQDAARWLVQVSHQVWRLGLALAWLVVCSLSDRCDGWFFLIGLALSSAQADGWLCLL